MILADTSVLFAAANQRDDIHDRATHLLRHLLQPVGLVQTVVTAREKRAMKSFVLEYHRRSGALGVEEFGPGRRAEAFRRRLARQREVDADTEVVVFHADTLLELRRTHGRYFESARELVERIAV